MVEWVPSLITQSQYLTAALVLIIGLVGGYIVGRLNGRILRSAGVPEAVEGTSLERTARKFGTDTVSIIAKGSAWIIYILSLLYALEVAELLQTGLLISQVWVFVPSYILALLILMVGLLVGDKAELLVSEYLRGVKLPEVSHLSSLVRYTVVFIAFLLALAQVGIAVGVLLILLAAYLFAMVLFSAVAFHHLLTSAAAGLYLLLNQPYGIGDRVAVGEKEGVVQEITVFVTRIEADGREFLIPNHLVFRRGAVVIRD